MNKFKRVVIFKIIMALCVFFIFFFMLINNNNNIENSIPELIEYRVKVSESGINMTDKSIEKLYDTYESTIYTEEVTNINTNYYKRPINCKKILTNENYLDIYNLQLLKGSNFDIDSVEEGKRIVIISDKIAVTLYKTLDVIGNAIEIDDKIYQIVGVYKSNKNLMYKFSSDGYERVIIPCSSVESIENKTIDSIAIQYDNNEKEIIISKLNEIIGDKLLAYSLIDYSEIKHMVMDIVNYFEVIMGIIINILIIIVIIKIVKKQMMMLYNDYKNYYLKELVIVNIRSIIRSSIKIILLFLLIIVVFKTVQFTPIINQEYISKDNIFELNYYLNQLISLNQSINNNDFIYNSNNFRLLFSYLKAQIINVIVLLISLASILMNIYSFIFYKNELKRKNE